MNPHNGRIDPPGLHLRRERAVFGDGTLLVFESQGAAAQAVASEIATLSVSAPFVLGLATGRSPVGLYRELIHRKITGDFPVKHLRTFALDEYCGLDGDDPRGFRRWLERELLTPLGVDARHARYPQCPADPNCQSLEEYDQAIAEAGGIDLQLLGLGRNGHIAFNEPGSSADSRTRVVPLADTTREDAASAFGGLDHVPTHAVTMGIASIRAARRIRVLAFGREKAPVVRRTLAERAGEEWPAAMLHGHSDVQLIVDVEAWLG